MVLTCLTNKYPGAVLVHTVPRNIFVHSQRGLALIQLIDQLHFGQWAEKQSKIYSCCNVIDRVRITVWRLFSTRRFCLLSGERYTADTFYVAIKHKLLSLFHCHEKRKENLEPLLPSYEHI